MITKVCFKCLVNKPLTDYYAHKQMGDGYLGKCKDCTKADTKKRTDILVSTPEGLEKERARHRDKYHRLEYKEKHKPTAEKKRAIMERYNSKYPEKRKAKNISYSLKVITAGNELHHWNYNVEFAKDVIELNPKDHAKIHRFIKYDPKTFMYKDLRGNLLDSREKHIEYINTILKTNQIQA